MAYDYYNHTVYDDLKCNYQYGPPQNTSKRQEFSSETRFDTVVQRNTQLLVERDYSSPSLARRRLSGYKSFPGVFAPGVTWIAAEKA